MARNSYRTVPPVGQYDRDAAAVLRSAMNGKTNNVTDATLVTGTAVTVLSHPLISPNSLIVVVPTTVNAAAVGQVWASGRTQGSCNLNYSATKASTSDCVFVVGIWG